MDAANQGDRPLRCDPYLLGLVALLVCALLPLAAHFVVHHPDERHYTDSALRMVQTGDYLTPQTIDGQPRFKKPVLTYWLVAVSYRLFGVHTLASRLPFVLLGGVVVWLTYELAWIVTAQRRLARLAACATACNPLLLCAATRSLPDVLLCACLAASALGFVAMIVAGRREPRYYWLAYLGVGLAVATKGLPALVWLAFVWEFALRNRWRPTPARQLVHTPAMVVSAAIGVCWFAAVWALHGRGSLSLFLEDQVHDRLTWVMWRPIGYFALAIALFWAMFIPWSLPLIDVLRRQRQALVPEQAAGRQFAALVVTWTLAVATAMACVNHFSERYALPLTPLLAVLLVDVYQRVDRRLLAGSLARVSLGLAFVVAALLVVTIAIHGQLGIHAGTLAAIVILAGCAGAAAGLSVKRHDWEVRGTAVAVLWLLLPPVAFLLVQPIAVPDQGTQIARALAKLEMQNERVDYCGRPALASKVRVCSGGTADLHWTAHGPRQAAGSSPVLLLPKDDVISAGLNGRMLYTASVGYDDLDADKLAAALARGKLAEFLRSREQSMVLAVEPARATQALRNIQDGKRWQ